MVTTSGTRRSMHALHAAPPSESGEQDGHMGRLGEGESTQ
jgi:hypothetical protein